MQDFFHELALRRPNKPALTGERRTLICRRLDGPGELTADPTTLTDRAIRNSHAGAINSTIFNP